MPKGDGLGFISKDYADLFRELRGDLVNKAPEALKPPYRVVAGAGGIDSLPMGVLRVKIRMPGDHPISDVVQGEYMKWSMVEALAQSFKKIVTRHVRLAAEVQRMDILTTLNPKSILMCGDMIKILEVHTPSMAGQQWQFCEFRFDYKVKIEDQDLAAALVAAVFHHMTDFEVIFCQNLESKFREIYHLTVLELINKRFVLMDGHVIQQQLQLFKAAKDNVQEVARLVKEVDVNAFQKEPRFPQGILDEDDYFPIVSLQRTPLHAAAEAGRLEVVQMLVQANAEVNYQDTSGFHALYLAAGSGIPQVVSYLLSSDAELHLRNKSGYTALHNAVGCGKAECIRVLLKARGDLNLQTRSGLAPVHMAAISNQPTSLEVLHECKANLDMPAVGGNTPVHEAVMQNNPEIIQKLFDLKADINIESGPDHHFATPLHMALERKKKKAVKKLQELKAVEKVPGGNHSDAAFKEVVEFRLRRKVLR